jgi:glycosyltransferase involved in cell wall biosynthesis
MDPKALGLFPPSRRLRFLVIGLNTRLACARSDTVIVQTHTMQNWMSAAGVDAGRIVVIEPCATIGAPMNSLSSPPPAMLAVPQNRRWLYVGSTEPHKNVQVLLSALEVVRRSLPETTLFATIPPQHPWARAPGVCALGTVPASQLAAVYRAATVLVMPSLVETVGLPMIEAFSAGLPVVAASRPYARDVCRDAAVFFESGDVSGLAAALQMLMLHSDERNRWAQLGRARAHHLADSRPYHRLVRACLHGPEKVE